MSKPLDCPKSLATFIHSINNLIWLGLHVDTPPTTACIYNLKWTPLQEPEPILVHDTYHLAGCSWLVCWSCSHSLPGYVHCKP